MKKIVSSVITAIALWAGTTAFVGSQMEESIEENINNINKVYADKGIQYKINSYEKSFFESNAKVEVEITDPTLLEFTRGTIKLPIVIDYQIEHGPVFLKNGLGLGAAKTHQEIALSSLLTPEAKTEFLSLIKDDIIIKSDMDISFTKDASYKATSNEVKFNSDGKSFSMTPLHMEGIINLETFKGDNTLKIDSLQFKEEGNQNGLQVENLHMNVNIDEFIEKTIMMGTIDLSMDKLSLKDDHNPKLNNINIAPNIHIVTKKDSKTTLSSKVDATIDFKDTKLPPELPALKNASLAIDMKKIGIKGLIEFQEASQEMQKKQSELFAKMQLNSKPENMQKIMEEFGRLQERLVAKIVHALNTLLVKDETVIGYGLNIETKDSKKSNASIKVGYTGDIKFEGSLAEIAMKAQKHALDMISLTVDLGLDATHIKSLPDAKKLKQQIQMAVAQGFIKEVNGKYILNGHYKNQELIVNDNNLTATVLPLLMMATQGGGF